MTTVGEQAQVIYERLAVAFGRDKLNLLASTFDSSTIGVMALVLNFPTDRLSSGDVISIGPERFLVDSYADITNTATVLRGHTSSPVVAHGIGETVILKPRFPFDILASEIITEIRSWPRDLYQIVTFNLSLPAQTNVVALPATTTSYYRVLEAWRPDLHGNNQPWKELRLKLLRNMDTSLYPSGFAIQLPEASVPDVGVNARVTMATSFDLVAADWDSDLQADIGLSDELLDVLMWGVGLRMLRSKLAGRADTVRQGQSRDASELPIGELTNMISQWEHTRANRLAEEKGRLLDLYPWRFR